MSEELIFGQTQIHRSILEALRGATEYVIWFSMLSQFKDPELEHTLNNLLSKNVKLLYSTAKIHIYTTYSISSTQYLQEYN